MMSFFKKMIVLVLAVLVLISCEQPVQAGLGNKVDITEPTIEIINPKSGSFLNGDITFEVAADDDIRVDQVYVYAALERDYDIKKADANQLWEPIQGPGEEGSDIWTWIRKTTNYDDGTFKVRFKVVDGAGKIGHTSDLIYQIKNLPPRIDLYNPPFTLVNRMSLNKDEIDAIRRGISISTGSFLTGYAQDSRGVMGLNAENAMTYPRIKIWREGDPKPANWRRMDYLSSNGLDGATGLEFRWILKDHPDDAFPDDDTAAPVHTAVEWPAYQEGAYRVQIQAFDSDGYGMVFPPVYTMDGVDYDYLPITVTPFSEQARLDVRLETKTPGSAYQSQAFSIQASATHSAGLKDIELLVRKARDPYQYKLQWRSLSPNVPGLDINGNETRTMNALSLSISPGGKYPLDTEGHPGMESIEFISGEYEFEINAYPSGSDSTHTTYTLNINIDDVPPDVRVTDIDPADTVNLNKLSDTALISPADAAYFTNDMRFNLQEARIVNGRVTVNVRAADASGLGTESENNREKRQIKYLLIKADGYSETSLRDILPYAKSGSITWENSGGLNPNSIYDGNAAFPPGTQVWAGFLDDLPDTSIPAYANAPISSPTTDTLIINTSSAELFPLYPANPNSGKGELYLFLAAKDKAGNLASLTKNGMVIGYHLHVDQEKDKPRISFDRLNRTIHSKEELPGSVNVLQGDIEIRGTLLDDDGIIITGRTSYTDRNPQPKDTLQFALRRWNNDATPPGWESAWHPLILSEDLRTKVNAPNAELSILRNTDFVFYQQDLGKAFDPVNGLPDGIYQLKVHILDAGNDIFGNGNLKNGDAAVEGGIDDTQAICFAINTSGPKFVAITPSNRTFVNPEREVSVTLSAATDPLHLEVSVPLSFQHPDNNLNLASVMRWDIDYLRLLKTAYPADRTAWLDWTKPEIGKFYTEAQFRSKINDYRTVYPGSSEEDAKVRIQNILNTVLNSITDFGTVTEGIEEGANRPTKKWVFTLKFDQDHLNMNLTAQDFFLVSRSESLGYQLDMIPPVLDVSSPAEGTYLFGNGSVRGRAWDPNRDDDVFGREGGKVAEIYYWLLKPGQSPAQIPPPFSRTSGEWTQAAYEGPVNISPVFWNVPIIVQADAGAPLPAPMPEGKYKIYLVAIDQAGQLSTAHTQDYPVAHNPFFSQNTRFREFGVDLNPPSLTANTGGNSLPSAVENVPAAYQTGEFDLQGLMDDSNGIESLIITQTKGSEFVVLDFFSAIDHLGTGNAAKPNEEHWTLPHLPRTAQGQPYGSTEISAGKADGTYSYKIIVTDKAGRTMELTRVISLDTQNPEARVSPSQQRFFDDALITINGSATDDITLPRDPLNPSAGSYTVIGTGIKELYFTQAAHGNAFPVKGADGHFDFDARDGLNNKIWIKNGDPGNDTISGTYAWQISLYLTGNPPQGERWIGIAAVDNAGHHSDIEQFRYSLDSSPPQLTEDHGSENEVPSKETIILSGEAGDSNALESLVIQQKRQDSHADFTVTGVVRYIKSPASSTNVDYSGTLPPYNTIYTIGGTDPIRWTRNTWTSTPAAGTSGLYINTGSSSAPNWVALPDLPLKKDSTAPSGYKHHTGESGVYTYTITAMDAADRPTVVRRTINVDIDPPVLAAAADWPPDNKWYDNAVILRGTADDRVYDGSHNVVRTGSGVASIYYWVKKPGVTYLPGAVPPANLGDWTSAGGLPERWSIALDIAQDADYTTQGEYQVYIKAEDKAGNLSPLLYAGPSPAPGGWNGPSYTFRVDHGAPEMALTFADVTTISEVHFAERAFGIHIAPQDDYSLKTLTVTQKKGDDAPIPIQTVNFPQGTTAPPAITLGNLPWEWDGASSYIPVSDLSAANGIYTYEITLTDESYENPAAAVYLGIGPSRRVVKTTTIYLDSKAPKVEIVTPASTMGPPAFNTRDLNARFTGTAVDDAPGTTAAVAAWIGAYTGGTAPAVPWAALAFDTSVTPAILSPGAIAAGWQPAVGTTSWSVVYEFTHAALAAEGHKLIAVAALDNAGHISPAPGSGNPNPGATLVFYVDRVAPALTETSINASSARVKDVFTLAGTITETNDMGSLTITQQKQREGTGGNGTHFEPKIIYRKTSGFTPGAAANPWFIPGTNGLEAGPPSLPRQPNATDITAYTSLDLQDGVYIYTITAEDAAGNTATPITRTVVVDTTKPTITVDISNNQWFLWEPMQLSGTAADTAPAPIPTGSLVNPSGVAWIMYWIGESGGTPVAPDLSAASAANPNTVDSHYVWITGALNWRDILDLTQLMSHPKFAGNLSNAEGSKKLRVYALDGAGNLSDPVDRIFGIDKDPPALTNIKVEGTGVNSPNAETTAAGSFFKLTGTVTDANPLESLKIVQERWEHNALVSTITVEEFNHPGNGAWTSNTGAGALLPRENATDQLDSIDVDATFIYKITARDMAGRETPAVRTVIIDKLGPTIEIKSPVAYDSSNPNYYQGSDLRINGVATDNNEVTEVWFNLLYGTDTTVNQSIDNLRTLVAGKWTYPAGKGWIQAANTNGLWNASLNFADNTAANYFDITEGHLKVWVVAKDIGGNWTDITDGAGITTPTDSNTHVSFYLDQNPPEFGKPNGPLPGGTIVNDFTFGSTVTIPSGSSIYYTNGGTNPADKKFTFSFTAADSNRLFSDAPAGSTNKTTPGKAITITRNGDPLTATEVILSNTNLTPATNPYNIAGFTGYDVVTAAVTQKIGAGAGELPDGTYTYAITVTDIVGRTRVLERTLVVDNSPPEIDIANITPVVGDNLVNGKFTFNATASDNNGVYGVKYGILPNGAPAPISYTDSRLIPTPGTPTAPYKYTVDTGGTPLPATVLADGPYKLYVFAQDRAGNEAHNYRDIVVDQSTDLPRITFIGWQKEAAAPFNWVSRTFTTGDKITGTLSDDDGILNDASLVFSILNSLGVPVAAGIPTSAVEAPGMIVIKQNGVTPREFTFSYTIPDATGPNTLAEGAWQIKALVYDAPSLKEGKNSVSSTETVPFKIDRDAPKIAISTINGTDVSTPGSIAATAKAGPVIAKGTLEEGNINRFKVSLNGALATGFALYTANPSLDDYPADASIPDGLTLYAFRPDGKTRYWTYKIPVTIFNPLEDGPNSFMLEAEDEVGWSSTKGGSFYKDQSGPDINFTNINEDRMVMVRMGGTVYTHPAYGNSETALRAHADVITDNNPKLTGTFSDEFSPLFQGGNKKFFYRLDSLGNSTDDTGWTEAADATFLPSLDTLDFTQKTTRWSIPLYTSAGGVNTPIAEGVHTMDIKVSDSLGNVNQTLNPSGGTAKYNFERVVFAIDSSAPAIVITPKDGTNKAIQNGDALYPAASGLAFNLLATVSDLNLKSIRATMPPVSGTTPYPLFSWDVPTSGWTPVPVPVSRAFNYTELAGVAGSSGVYTITIVADDGARQTREEIRFTLDNEPPQFNLSNLDITKISSDTYPTRYIESSPRIQGTVSDDTGIGYARYKLEKYNYTTTQYSLAYTATGSGEWLGWRDLKPGAAYDGTFVKLDSWAIDLTGSTGTGGLGLSDGKYRVSFKVGDKVGNLIPNTGSSGGLSYLQGLEFYIDSSSPVLKLKEVNNPPFYSGRERINVNNADTMYFKIFTTDSNTIITVKAKLDSSDFTTGPIINAQLVPSGTTDPTLISDTPESFNYELHIPVFTPSGSAVASLPGVTATNTEGIHTLYLEAVDTSGRAATLSRDFTFDSMAPQVVILEPANQLPTADGATVYSAVRIRGVTTDNNAVKTLEYQFGNADISANTWRPYNQGINASGAITTAYTNTDLVQGAGSLYNWTLSFPNINDLTKTAYGAAYVTKETGADRYDLLIKFRVVDAAGNSSILDYKLVVNPAGDNPEVIIDSPSPSATGRDREIGGEVRVNGSALDNDWIAGVVYRVIKTDNTTANPTAQIYSVPGAVQDSATNAIFAAAPYNDSRGGWYPATINGALGSRVSWSFNINGDGQLNPGADSGNERPVTVQVAAYDASPQDPGTRKTLSVIFETHVTFVNGQPAFSTITVTNRGSTFDVTTSNRAIAEIFTLRAKVRDDNGLKSISWHGEDTTVWTNILTTQIQAGTSGNGPNANISALPNQARLKRPNALTVGKWYFIYEAGANYAGAGAVSSDKGSLFKAVGQASSGAGWVLEAVNQDGTDYNGDGVGTKAFYEYDISITADSGTLVGKNGVSFAARADNFIISLQAIDNSLPNPFQAVYDTTLKVDNYYPFGTYTGNGVASGGSYSLQGTAWDSGVGANIQGISRIVAWFSREGIFIPLNEKSGASFTAQTDPVKVMMGRSQDSLGVTLPGAPANINTGAGSGSGAIKFPDLSKNKAPPNGAGTYPNPDYTGISGIEIDKNEPSIDNDQDNFLEGLADAGLNYQWFARFDTTKMYDGLVRVHYVVYDAAGNGSYFEHSIFINNNPPRVERITIATDVLNAGNIDDTRGHRVITSNYETTNVVVRNNRLNFKIKITGDDSITAKPFHYRFGYVYDRVANVKPSELIPGEIYAITTLGDVSWDAVGAPEGYRIGTAFMATSSTNFGDGRAERLLIAERSYNRDAMEVDYYYDGGYFGAGTTQIRDSTVPNDAWFIIKVYNSLRRPMQPDTGATADGLNSGVYSSSGQFTVMDQPFQVVRIGLTVYNDDKIAPKAKLWDLNPTGEYTNEANTARPTGIGSRYNLDKGGIFNPRGNTNRDIDRSGHIEPRFAVGQNSTFIEEGRDTNFPKDTVSGKIILRGYAFDDQRLGEVQLKFGNDAPFTILSSDNNSPYGPASGSTSTRGLLTPVAGQNAFVFNNIDLEGHQAEWAYIWDTTTLPANTIVGDDIKVQVIVRDKRSSPNVNVTRLHPNTGETGTTGTNDGFSPLASNEGYNRIAVNIHPYILGFGRDTSKGYHNTRSRQGWYTFSRGETVTMTGSNLKNPSGNSRVVFQKESGEVDAAISSQNATSITFTVPVDAVSGQIRLVTSANNPTMNERNNNLNSWNREDYNPRVEGNELWKDDRAVHIWQSNNDQGASDRGYFAGSTRPEDPSMTMDPLDGTLWGAWANTSDYSVRFKDNKSNYTAASDNIIRNHGGGGLDNTDIYLSANRRSSGPTIPTVFYHNSRSYNSNWSSDDSGGLKGFDPAGTGYWDANLYNSKTGQYNVELTFHDQILDQFKNPRVVTRGNEIHVSYFDSKDNSMKYWYGRSGWTGASEGAYSSTSNNNPTTTSNSLTMRQKRWINLDGDSDAMDIYGENRLRSGSLGRIAKAGKWSAIDLRTDGTPVVAYYDEDNQTLRLAYTTTAVNPAVGTWTAQYAMPNTDPNFTFSGQYVSMAIQQTGANANDLHLAFFKTDTTDLVYLQLKWENGKYVPRTPSVIVDNAGAVGWYADLTLDRDNKPWISYLDLSSIDNYDGVKMAYYDYAKYNDPTTEDKDVNGVSKQGWETMQVPALYKVGGSRTGIEAWPSRDTPAATSATLKPWAAAIGYANDDWFRIAYYLRPKN
jgi:hypothetical protein